MEQQIIERFPGISCAYRDAEGKETTKCYGVADKQSNILVDDSTIFPAYSISKFVTALCVMKLYEKRLLDILEGRTSYNNRPVRAEKAQGMEFEYSDAGYCVLQLLLQEIMHKPFEDVAQEVIFDKLGLKNTFFASTKNIAYFENNKMMITGYDGEGLPIPGRFPPFPDLAASGLWCTPTELCLIAKEFIAAFNGKSDFLQEKTAREMANPLEHFSWTGLGVFVNGKDILMSQGWGECGQCMMKMNCTTEEIAIVMTNRNPESDQAESGVEWLVDRKLRV